MKTVHKFELSLFFKNSFTIGKKCKVVHFAYQNNKPMVWIEVTQNQYEELKEIELEVFGTGHDIPSDMTHVTTIVEGAFVWHLYMKEYK